MPGPGFRRIGEFDNHGIGTHDISVSDDGRMLVIANGGIETHPDFGRTKLNLDPYAAVAGAAGCGDGKPDRAA